MARESAQQKLLVPIIALVVILSTFIILFARQSPISFLTYKKISSTDPSTTWKSYENSKLGISMSIPSSWHVYDRGYRYVVDGKEYFTEMNAVLLSPEPFPEYIPEGTEYYFNGLAVTITPRNTDNVRSDVIIAGQPATKTISDTRKENSLPPAFQRYTITYTFDLPQNSTQSMIISASAAENTSLDTSQLDQILSTLNFIGPSTSPTCVPRPKCLDTEPRCMMPETADMCPKAD